MQDSGLVQASKGADGQEMTWGTSPPLSPPAGGYKPQNPGDGFVTFSVPSANVYGGGGSNGWVQIVGGGSLPGRVLGLPPGMPPFTELSPFPEP